MSKRRNRKSSPNLPQETLERARQQIAGDNPVSEPAEAAEPEAKPVEAKAAPVATAASPSPRVTTRTRSSTRRREPSQARSGRRDQLDSDVVRERLLHPTRVVTQEQLREEYGYVVKDLRRIAVIAGAMIVLMIVLAQIV